MHMSGDFVQAGLIGRPLNQTGNRAFNTIVVRHDTSSQTRLMETPPSTSIAEPVVKLEASEARYNAD